MRAHLFILISCLFSVNALAQSTSAPASAPTSAPASLPANRPIQQIRCGDGFLDAGEECDDGNNQEGDDCASDCSGPASAIELPPESQPDVTVEVGGEPTSRSSLLNPIAKEGGPYYRSPKVAVGLSLVPTAASYIAFFSTILYQAISKEDATTALALSITGATIAPSVGMFYAQQPKLALGLTGARILSVGSMALGLAFDLEDDLGAKLFFGGALVFAGCTVVEFASLPDAAKRAHPPGTPKPATLLHQ